MSYLRDKTYWIFIFFVLMKIFYIICPVYAKYTHNVVDKIKNIR